MKLVFITNDEQQRVSPAGILAIDAYIDGVLETLKLHMRTGKIARIVRENGAQIKCCEFMALGITREVRALEALACTFIYE